MIPQPVVRFPAAPSWLAASTVLLAGVEGPTSNASRDAWITACSRRLLELRPHDDEESLQVLAADLWVDVGGHDPAIAAEMEDEAGWGV